MSATPRSTLHERIQAIAGSLERWSDSALQDLRFGVLPLAALETLRNDALERAKACRALRKSILSAAPSTRLEMHDEAIVSFLRTDEKLGEARQRLMKSHIQVAGWREGEKRSAQLGAIKAARLAIGDVIDCHAEMRLALVDRAASRRA